MSTNKNAEFTELINGSVNKNEDWEKLLRLISDKDHFNEPVSETTLKNVIASLRKLTDFAGNLLQEDKKEADLGWMDTYNALKYLTISKGKLRKLRDTGKLPAYKLDGKQYYKKTDLQKMFKLLNPSELMKPED
ncbi:MAG: hypothetical protein FD170_1873 [Bacteroidetes bacterium]|nr:MAG: hypothetical protein FD170_1873 [Bacteroidota bacterium]